ncbi:MAG TPA: hypothetical protein VFA47_11040 [Candidatus Manganitrophaceae bacterium]|nr:hypothetical protein [Candidatus Manganitrophaceae bacterium]
MGFLIRAIVLLLAFSAPFSAGGEEAPPPREPQSEDVFVRIPSPRFLQSGERRVIDLVLSNPGEAFNFYTLSIQKKPEGWLARVDPTHVDLGAHQEHPIHLTLIPRRGPPSFTEQMTQYDIIVKAEDKQAKAFYGTVPVYLKPGRHDLFVFFGGPAVIGFAAIWIGGWLRRRRQFRIGGLFVMGGGILAIVSITAVLGILII